MRNCNLSGLTDLYGATEYVRQAVAGYFNKLVNIGVAGFRIDAAKHMWPEVNLYLNIYLYVQISIQLECVLTACISPTPLLFKTKLQLNSKKDSEIRKKLPISL